MDETSSPSELPPGEAQNIIRGLRDELSPQTQLVERLMAYFQIKPETLASWFSSERGETTEAPHSSLRIRRIMSDRPDNNRIGGRLRATWLGRLYTTHLKRYGVIRRIAHWIWRNGYPVYVNVAAVGLSKGKTKRWRPLTALSGYAKRTGLPIYKLADSAAIESARPKVFPACDQGCLESSSHQYAFPELFVATMRNAMIYGGTNLIVSSGEVVCHDLYDFKRDSTSEELHGRTLIDPKRARIRWLCHDEVPETIAVAATFVDACALNYAHWMTEVLPRIELFCSVERFKAVPIVVNDALHPNIIESLLLVVDPDREIIALPIGRALAVDELYVTSVAGYVPFGRRTNARSGYSHGVFSPWAMGRLRSRFAAQEISVGEDSPKRIFLRRNSGARRLTNAHEVEGMLTAQGYEVVEPEKLTFLQQIRLFNNAEVIISSTGAALANALASKPGTNVVVLMGKHEDMIYGYWNNLLSPLGITVSYVLGDIVENHELGIHGNFAVSLDCVRDLIEDLVNK